MIPKGPTLGFFAEFSPRPAQPGIFAKRFCNGQCQPDITLDNWVVPGQAGYELCIANGFSATSRQASLFGQDLFFAKHCPRSVRSAFSVDNPDRNGFSIEQACAGSDPDWITTM
eukprot:COSAG04_NODE_14344_length_571_cov_418.364407_1_plen_113_part_10